MRNSTSFLSTSPEPNPCSSAQIPGNFVFVIRGPQQVWFWLAAAEFRRSLAISAIVAIFIAISAFAQTSTTADSSRSSGWVVISVSEYESLRARAYPGEREPEPSPVDATLTRVDYDLHIASELATGRASLTVDVLKDGWVRVPVPSGLLVREARLDGKLVSLVSNSSLKGGTQPAVVLSRAGRAVLQLDIALPVNASAGEDRISLPSTHSDRKSTRLNSS